jgi:hypothetical protein
MDFTQIEHQAAVDGLKAAGNHVNLVRSMFSIVDDAIKQTISILVDPSFSATFHGRNSITKACQRTFGFLYCWWHQP